MFVWYSSTGREEPNGRVSVDATLGNRAKKERMEAVARSVGREGTIVAEMVPQR
jgi:hypothetical protein